ncbi:unnamed protein product [Symbiodinium microadriaticum]|nr:unnamed protein product [Symbiodinium microadriaticum]
MAGESRRRFSGTYTRQSSSPVRERIPWQGKAGKGGASPPPYRRYEAGRFRVAASASPASSTPISSGPSDWALSCKLVTAPENATHVVVARRTEKWLKALALQEAGGLSIVHPGWLLYAAVTWRRPCEEKRAAAEASLTSGAPRP